MGLSSSQSRFLTLTARLSDLELKAQNIQHQKIEKLLDKTLLQALVVAVDMIKSSPPL